MKASQLKLPIRKQLGQLTTVVILALGLLPMRTAEAGTTWVPASAKIDITIGYTLGTHKLHSASLSGGLTQAGDSLESVSGELLVPIREIKEGSEKLECHLQSSLGIDYTKSRFPGEHVCDSDNRLPETGPDRIVYPNIELKIEKLKKVSEDLYEAEARWTIHGVSQKVPSLRMKLENRGDEIVSTGETQFRLSDFGIVVKRAFVISVSETTDMKWSITFNKAKGEKP
jgi:hypothetical protein